MSRLPQQFRAILALVFAVPFASQATGLAVYRLDSTPSTLTAELVPGRVNVVMLWTTDCPVCRAQYPVLSRFHDTHRSTDATVLGIALADPDDRAEVAAYQATTKQSFPSVIVKPEVMLDAFEHAAGEPFGGTPTYLIFDATGTLGAYLVGPTTDARLAELVAGREPGSPE